MSIIAFHSSTRSSSKSEFGARHDELITFNNKLGLAGRTLHAMLGVSVALLDAGELAGVDRHGLAVAALDEQHRTLEALDGRDRAIMQPGIADRFARS